MFASDIVPTIRGVSIENPNSDSNQLWFNDYQKEMWLKRNGNVEVIYDEKRRTYIVPQFAESRKKYSEIKQIDCDRWGCE